MFTDSTLGPGTSHTYCLITNDHLNGGGNNITAVVVTAAAAGSFDPRRMGVKPNGAYWGAEGENIENIDMPPGNLNYTIPLLKEVGRGQSPVAIALSYNSQNWRKDTPATWKLGGDIGYGFGWRLQAGSVTPYCSDWWNIHHWVYTDATGAQ